MQLTRELACCPDQSSARNQREDELVWAYDRNRPLRATASAQPCVEGAVRVFNFNQAVWY
jgi:hypothetical protein